MKYACMLEWDGVVIRNIYQLVENVDIILQQKEFDEKYVSGRKCGMIIYILKIVYSFASFSKNTLKDLEWQHTMYGSIKVFSHVA